VSRRRRRKSAWTGNSASAPRRRLGCLLCQGSPIPGWVQGKPETVGGTVHDNNVTPCRGCNCVTAEYVARTKGTSATTGIPDLDHQQRAAGER